MWRYERSRQKTQVIVSLGYCWGLGLCMCWSRYTVHMELRLLAFSVHLWYGWAA